MTASVDIEHGAISMPSSFDDPEAYRLVRSRGSTISTVPGPVAKRSSRRAVISLVAHRRARSQAEELVAGDLQGRLARADADVAARAGQGLQRARAVDAPLAPVIPRKNRMGSPDAR